MKRLQLVRKKLLPLLLCMAVAGSQVSVMAADVGGFSDSAEGFDEEWAEDTQTQSAEAEDTTEIAEENTTENTGIPDEQTEDSAGAADGDTEDIALQSSGENTETPEISEKSYSDSQESDSREDTFGDGEESFGDASDSGESGIEYIKGRPLTEEEEQEQLAPFDNLTFYSTAMEIGNDVDEVPMGRAAAYPSYYNAADQGYVTSVKNQEPYGMCWAFGMASLLETSFLTQGLGAYDLSEEHLAYFFANRKNDPLGNTYGDVNKHMGTDDKGNADYHEGGNDLLASMFLSTWSGMTTEGDVPLATDSTHTQKTGVTPAASKAYNAAAYLKNAYFSDYSVNAMKKLLVANNSVTVMYNAQNAYYNASTAAYSYPASTKNVNHVVTVVGWDDNYSAKNFRASSKVKGDGAWIVKNSWGTGWGKSGYFYMSYEDKSVSELVAATAVNTPKYRNNYFYDGTSGLGSIRMYAGEQLSTVFRASAGNGKAESLGEVTLSSMSANNSYTVQVYTNLKDASDPTSGTPAYSTPVSCSQPMAGVMTFQIPEVLLSQNSLYSIVVTNAGSTYIKYCVEAEVSYGWCSFSPSIVSGQSFLRYNAEDTWMDAVEFNPSVTPRIKAHTRTLSSAARMQLSSSEISLYSGDQKTLNASATRSEMDASGIVWESSDISVAAVNGSGVVTAKNPGTATITCYGKNARGIRAACKVTVKLRQTTGVKLVSKAFNRIRISWKAVPGCNRYAIYRWDERGNSKKMATVTADVVTWQDTAVKTGSTYTYRIRASYVRSGKKTVYGAASSPLSAKAELGKARAVAKAVSGPCNRVSWKKVSGASGYYIYRKLQGKSWVRIGTVNNKVLSWQDTEIEGITSYAYAVRPYKNVDGKKVLGGYQASSYILSYPELQKISCVRKTSRGLKICWKAQKKADCYQIYRKTGKGSWKKISTVSGGSRSSFEDKTAKKGTTYYYAVRAGIKTSGGRVLCGGYAAKSAKR